MFAKETFQKRRMELRFFKYLFLSFFILRQKESELGRGREKGRENPKQASHCHCRARCGARTHKPSDNDQSHNLESDI